MLFQHALADVKDFFFQTFSLIFFFIPQDKKLVKQKRGVELYKKFARIIRRYNNMLEKLKERASGGVNYKLQHMACRMYCLRYYLFIEELFLEWNSLVQKIMHQNSPRTDVFILLFNKIIKKKH